MNKYSRIKVSQAEVTSWAMNEKLIPAYMVTMIGEIDATCLEKLRGAAKHEGRSPPSFTALVLKAAALTMKKNPEANRAILGPPFFRRLHQFHNTDISIAIEKNLPYLPGQAHAEPIERAHEKTLEQITSELRDLAQCDESNNPRFRMFMKILKFVPYPVNLWMINSVYWDPSLWVQHRGCAAWVNAPSKSGASLVFATWPWPITFSFGVVKMRPFVVDDKVEARPVMPLVMVFDRRIMGGGPAGRIFSDFMDILKSGQL